MFVGEEVNKREMIPLNCMGLIRAGCGTGKTYFAVNMLPVMFPEIKPSDIIVVTSRALPVEQQTIMYSDVAERRRYKDVELAEYLNGISSEYWNDRLQIMTITKFVWIATHCRSQQYDALCRVKMIVIDECHALASDTFMEDMSLVANIVGQLARNTKVVVVGMSATPGILFDEEVQDRLGLPVRMITDKHLVAYKAKNFRTAYAGDIPALLNNGTIKGKTLVMFNDRRRVKEWAAKIEDSAYLVSSSSMNSDSQEAKCMQSLRRYIAEHRSLPDEVDVLLDGYSKPVRRKLRVLITTSTLREGIEFEEGCGIENVICCAPNEIDTVQLAGRCRFNIELLVVAGGYKITGENEKNSYIKRQENEFNEYFNGGDDHWLTYISDITDRDNDPLYGEKLRIQRDYGEFYREVRKNLIGVKIYKDTWEETFNPILDRCHVVRKNSIGKYVKKDIKALLLKAFDIEEGHGTTRTERRAYIIIKEKEDEYDLF